MRTLVCDPSTEAREKWLFISNVQHKVRRCMCHKEACSHMFDSLREGLLMTLKLVTDQQCSVQSMQIHVSFMEQFGHVM